MCEWSLSTPVTLIIFNRPETTVKVFEAIREMRPPKMLIIADGPRHDKPGEVQQCDESRMIVENVDWPCEVLTNYAQSNLGCKIRVASGLDWVFKNVEETIILEDDCLPAPTFFRFCDELLNKYRDDERIGIISGNNFQFGRRRTNYSYYFSRIPHTWGWATWRRTWKRFDLDMKLWPKVRDEKWLCDILKNKKNVKMWEYIFEQVYTQEIDDAWDFQLTFACWLNSLLNIIPNVNMVTNIGYGANATHYKTRNKFNEIEADNMMFPLHNTPIIIADTIADDFTFDNNFGGGPISSRIIDKIMKLVRMSLRPNSILDK